MTNEVTESATPMSGSSMSDIIRSAHSFITMFGYFRYKRNRVSAAFFFTNAFDALRQLVRGRLLVNMALTVRSATGGRRR